MTPEQNIYSQEEALPFADYLESKRGESIGTAEMRMHSTAHGEFSSTEEVYEVLEELEKGSFIQKIEQNPEDRWRISPYTDQGDVMKYLTDEAFTGRSYHPLGPEFEEKDVKGAVPLEELL